MGNPNRPASITDDTVGVYDIGILATEVDNILVANNFFSELYWAVFLQDGSSWRIDDNRIAVRYYGQFGNPYGGAGGIFLGQVGFFLDPSQTAQTTMSAIPAYTLGIPTQFNRVRRNDIFLHSNASFYPVSAGYPEPDFTDFTDTQMDLTGILLVSVQQLQDWDQSTPPDFITHQPTRFNEILDNTIYSSGVARAGIRLLGYTTNPLPDNPNDQTTGDPYPMCMGSYMNYNRIERNELTNVGIQVLSGDDNKILGNTIRNPRWLQGTSLVQRISDDVSPLFMDAGAGIWIASGSGNCINDNTIIASVTQPINGKK